MTPVKYGPTSPATVAAIASSSSARPSATRPASIIARPWRVDRQRDELGVTHLAPDPDRVGDPGERAVQVAGEQCDGGLERGHEALLGAGRKHRNMSLRAHQEAATY